MGLFTGFWLKRQSPSLSVMVFEKDSKYKNSTTILSCGGIRQQFSLKEHVQLSKFSAEFISAINDYLSVPNGEPVDVQFREDGYLFLATSEESANTILENHKIQKECNACVEILTPDKLKERFPWLNTDGLHFGSLGVKHEGCFDPHLYLTAVKRKVIHLGVKYTEAEVIDFVLKSTGGSEKKETCNSVIIKTSNGETKEVNFSFGVIAAGYESGRLSRLLKIGTPTEDCRKVCCPVEPRKRFIFVFACPDKSIKAPMVVDPTGVHFRSESKNFISGKSPASWEEPDTNNLDVDYTYFDKAHWPILAKRVQAFEAVKVIGAWSGFYDYNYFDENEIIGKHPYYSNLFWITGFSGHGIQMAAGAGKALSELILYDSYQSIDLTKLGWQRILSNTPVYETNII
ncbi:fad oxidoreductase-like protein [Dinothrombium tinctorium]|nr:fad oxidoreductase-like protein [Dinothrombium tinctorium]